MINKKILRTLRKHAFVPIYFAGKTFIRNRLNIENEIISTETEHKVGQSIL